jgi:hypothetical protein
MLGSARNYSPWKVVEKHPIAVEMRGITQGFFTATEDHSLYLGHCTIQLQRRLGIPASPNIIKNVMDERPRLTAMVKAAG